MHALVVMTATTRLALALGHEEAWQQARTHISVKPQTRSRGASLMTPGSCYMSLRSWSSDSHRISSRATLIPAWSWRCLWVPTRLSDKVSSIQVSMMLQNSKFMTESSNSKPLCQVPNRLQTWVVHKSRIMLAKAVAIRPCTTHLVFKTRSN